MLDFCCLFFVVMYQACMGRYNPEDPSASILPHHGRIWLKEGFDIWFHEKLSRRTVRWSIEALFSTPLAVHERTYDNIKGR